MAYNTQLRVSNNGDFSGDGQLIYVATDKALVNGLLDGAGKLNTSLVPDWLFNAKRNGGTITANKTFEEVFLQIKSALGLSLLSNSAAAALMNGGYVEVNAINGVTISGSDYFRGFCDIGDDGQEDQVSLTLEHGDRVTFIAHSVLDADPTGLCSIIGFDYSTTPPTLITYHDTESECTTAGGTWLANIGGDPLESTSWSVVNSTEPLAVAGASEGASTKGLMSGAHAFKLHNLVNIKSLASEFGLDGNGNLTIDDATTSAKGKVQIGTGLEVSSGVATLRKATTSLLGGVIVSTGLEVDASANLTLRKATASLLGGVIVEASSGLTVGADGKLTLTPQTGQIADLATAKAGTDNTKIMTPLRVWDQTKNLLGLRIYTNLTNANAAGHPTGAYALVQV
jgi:hypothetical protein